MTLLIAAAMAWAGWLWLPAWSTAWWLAELPAAVILAGFLLRDREPVAAAYWQRVAAADRAPRWTPPRARQDAPEHTEVFVLAPVVDLDTYRQRRAA